MSVQLSMTEKLMYSTARIECQLRDGGSSTGTGFFFRFCDNGEFHIPAIVTNKHVVEGAIRGRFCLSLSDEQGNPINGSYTTIELDNFESHWIKHPETSIDLCIIPIAPLLVQAESQGQKFYYVPLDATLVPDAEKLSELTAMEDVVMIGYPNGLWDSVNNLPIIRKGITATHPNMNYNGKAEFMIDAACFPGSSGSPVLLLNLGSYPRKDGSTVLGNRVMLLGVLYAGPQHFTTGEIQIVNVPTRQQPIAVTGIPNNLGIVIKSRKLLDFNSILLRLNGEPKET